MLSKNHRLTKNKDFETVFKKGKSIKKGFLLFKVLTNNLKNSRFGFVVSKKISNRAVVRNRIRRVIRSVVLKEMDNFRDKNIDVVIVALAGIEKEELLEIRKTTSDLLKRL